MEDKRSLLQQFEDNDKLLVWSRYLTPILKSTRIMAYFSEGGEALRPLIHKYLLRLLYGLSIGYVMLDTSVHTLNVYQQTKDRNMTIINTIDKALWHTSASIILPALTIHSIVKYSGRLINHQEFFRGTTGSRKKDYIHFTNRFSKYGYWTRCLKYAPPVLGLVMIPVVIHPLDEITDYVMNYSIRRMYHNKLIS
jgi:fission process protein 1